MQEAPFYAPGLRFSCTRCSACCRYESGFVFLSEQDVRRLAAARQMGYTDFMNAYCRWAPESRSGADRECLSLKEKSNFDCVFWDGGCTVYDARPVQCRTFPFWRSVLSAPESWEMAGSACPGIGQGRWYSREEIEACLAEQRARPLIYRDIRKEL